jgi:hypothetical protein
VLLDLPPLVRRQGAGLLQDLIGHVHLPDVVQDRRVPDFLRCGGIHAELRCEQTGALADAAHVPPGVLVLGFTRDGEHVDRVEVRLVQRRGPLGHALLERLRILLQVDGLLEDRVAQLGDDVVLLLD